LECAGRSRTLKENNKILAYSRQFNHKKAQAIKKVSEINGKSGFTCVLPNQ